MATRSDGVRVMQCSDCLMGVVEKLPDDLASLYAGDYYGREASDASGYADYLFTSSHSLAWVAAFVELASPAHRILDVGCADGFLLSLFPSTWERLGIEANPHAAATATDRGIDVVANDLLDPLVGERLQGSVPIVTAIAVLEHLRDIRLGVERVADLLTDDGLFVFEVPLLHGAGSDNVWLSSSLEHVWYPTEAGIERLVKTELGLYLAGMECFVEGYGSTYVGVITKHRALAETAQDLVWRVLRGTMSGLRGPEERRVRALYQLVHSADSSDDVLALLPSLHGSDASPELLQRLVSLWQRDRAERDALLRLGSELASLGSQLASLGSRVDGWNEELSNHAYEAAARHDELRADLARGFARLARTHQDSLVHRSVRCMRGAAILIRGIVHRQLANDIVHAARVFVDADARSTWSSLFDRHEYLDSYSDVAKANVPAPLHYMLLGHREGREPSSRFSGTAYLAANRDVADVGMNPLVHFATKGQREGRPITRPSEAVGKHDPCREFAKDDAGADRLSRA